MMGIVYFKTVRFGRAEPYPEQSGLFLLMPVFSETLLTLVRCHFVLLSFLTAWHSVFEFLHPFLF